MTGRCIHGWWFHGLLSIVYAVKKKNVMNVFKIFMIQGWKHLFLNSYFKFDFFFEPLNTIENIQNKRLVWWPKNQTTLQLEMKALLVSQPLEQISILLWFWNFVLFGFADV